MNIGEVIRKHRKIEGLTQEQIASYLNISTSAVNKWENGVSYPDITLISSLARFLRIDVNILLEFNEKLTSIEINSFTKEIREIIIKDGYESAFDRGTDLIKRYVNCDELIINIAMALYNNLHLVSGFEERYKNKIIMWFEFMVKSDRDDISSLAMSLLSKIYINQEEYKKAQSLIEQIPNSDINKKLQQALLFKSKREFDKAYKIYEEVLLTNAYEISAVLSYIMRTLCEENRFSKADEYIELGKKIIDVLELGEYKKYELELLLAKRKRIKKRL